MKKILLFGAIALTTLSFGQNVPNYVPTNGLVGWWPFNGNANDESGNGNNGTLVNSPTLTNDRFSSSNSAFNFNGSGDYIDYGDVDLLEGFGSFSISVWFNPYDLGGLSYSESRPILSKWFSSGNLARCSWNVNIHNDSLNFSVTDGVNYHTSKYKIYNTYEWKHCVFTFNGGDINIYYNGTEILSETVSISTINNSNEDFSIGDWYNDQNNNYNTFKGLIDDVALWNRALTQQEVTDLYTACSQPTANILAQGSTTFCQGGSVVLEATSGSNYTYQWYENGNAINGETNQTYTVSNSGNYTVKVMDGVCEETSTSKSVTVNSNPTVSFTLPNLIHNENGNYVLNASPSGGTYSGIGVTGNTFDPLISGLGTVSITYDYTDNNSCSDSKTVSTIVYDTTGTVCTSYVSVAVTDTLIIDVSLAGLSAPNNINTMKVYPNPSNDIVNIDNGNYALMNGYSIKIINANAQEVFNAQINSQLLQVAVSQLGATGNYFINVYDNNQLLIESKVLVLQ